jgi:hypothetical protein
VTRRGTSARPYLAVEPEALRLIAEEGMTDIAHLLRPGHLQQLAGPARHCSPHHRMPCTSEASAEGGAYLLKSGIGV